MNFDLAQPKLLDEPANSGQMTVVAALRPFDRDRVPLVVEVKGNLLEVSPYL